MKNGFAWAALLCLTASGCASSGMFGKVGCDSCRIAQSRNAPRPQMRRDACVSSCGGLFGGRNKTADCCGDGCCDDGCCGDGGGGLLGRGTMGGRMGKVRDNCAYVASGWDDRCREMVGNVAGGMCSYCSDCNCQCNGGNCGPCSRCAARLRGMNPHSGGYPEQPSFAAGPATGQTAYPYYTTRGPRDFLQNNPTRIGPY